MSQQKIIKSPFAQLSQNIQSQEEIFDNEQANKINNEQSLINPKIIQKNIGLNFQKDNNQIQLSQKIIDNNLIQEQEDQQNEQFDGNEMNINIGNDEKEKLLSNLKRQQQAHIFNPSSQNIMLEGNINLKQEYNYDPNNPLDQEPPLLEGKNFTHLTKIQFCLDLGIDLKSIKTKIISILTFKKCDEQFIKEADLSGPLLIVLAFGIFLLMVLHYKLNAIYIFSIIQSGKIHFAYIYGFGVCGCCGIYILMNLMSQVKNDYISYYIILLKGKILFFYETVSILGYSLIPITILSIFNIPFKMKQVQLSIFGIIVSLFCISWSTYIATYFISVELSLGDRKWLIAYPICLFFSIFTLITIF